MSLQSEGRPREEGSIAPADDESSPNKWEGAPLWPKANGWWRGSSGSKWFGGGRPNRASLEAWGSTPEEDGGAAAAAGGGGGGMGWRGGIGGAEEEEEEGDAWPGRGIDDPWPRGCERQWSK